MSQTKLDSNTVSKVAKLARLSKQLKPEKLEKYGIELNSILNHVSELQKVDVSTISPLAGIRTISIDNLRADEPDQDQQSYQNVRTRIIENFPEKQGDFLAISGIFQ
jgi:aspartyl/glutamyl-tRNA(Asn/Gln) amidotransferase C subunit